MMTVWVGGVAKQGEGRGKWVDGCGGRGGEVGCGEGRKMLTSNSWS